MKEVEESFQAAGVNVRPEVLIDEAQYATVGAKEDSAVIFYPSKAQFAQRAISAERISVHAIIRFDEQICHSKNREEAARFAAF
jgi:hypothetical protein